MLTEGSIQTAVTSVRRGRKASVTISDKAPRGTGRLVLVVKPGRAEWYAQRYVGGKRKLQKLGVYPAVLLAEAREKFGGYRPATGRNTVGVLLDAYLATLAGRPAHKQAKSCLRHAGDILGRGRLARDITPADIVAVVKPVHQAGKIHMAEKHRMYLAAAFRWAILSTHDYRTANPHDWGITHNPVDALPKDERAYAAGTAWLDVPGFLQLLAWAEKGKPGTARHAIAVILLTGQRVSEVCRIESAHWDSCERTLHWPKTKNGRPHTVPVCERAGRLLDAIKATGPHLYTGNHPRPHLSVEAIRAALKGAKMTGFTARDLRRTWKTLSGKAGLTRVERDLIQNHGQTGISAKHYDRWEYMPEKRAGVTRWHEWLEQQVRDRPANEKARQIVDGKKQGHAHGVVPHDSAPA